jgi:tyrosyl-tRNA synthetase
MKLSEELAWRGFVNQTTLSSPTALDGQTITFYWGVDPSADSMTIGHLALAMMVRHFIEHGHKAILLVGGATGLIGDPDGKNKERALQSPEQIAHNKERITAQYKDIFAGQQFEIVDNYEWFKDMGYLQFLRETGKHVPMRQMLGRDFVQSRLGDKGSGISYAEFSYALIQGYDFLYLHRNKGVSLQVCGADQWGNSITGVDLIRRIEGQEAHVWSAPLVINRETGIKFGKTEAGAIWLDSKKTSPTQFYQFWINVDDQSVEDYLKIYTLLSKQEVDHIMARHREDASSRFAQNKLAQAVTDLVHGTQQSEAAAAVTEYLKGSLPIAEATPADIENIRREIPSVRSTPTDAITEVLVDTGLASSKTEARRLITNKAVSVNGVKIDRQHFEPSDFTGDRLLIRRGKAYKDSALVELK